MSPGPTPFDHDPPALPPEDAPRQVTTSPWAHGADISDAEAIEMRKREGERQLLRAQAVADDIHKKADALGEEDEPSEGDPPIVEPTIVIKPLPAAAIRRMEAASKAITMEERDAFIDFLATRGAWNQAAYSVGRSGAAFRRLAAEDPTFAMAVGQAAQDYRELIQAEIYRRGVVGWLEPVCGKDSVITTVRRHSDRLLELEAKAVWPARYRDNHKESDDTHRGGVLVVDRKKGPDEWQAEATHALQQHSAPQVANDLPKITRKVE